MIDMEGMAIIYKPLLDEFKELHNTDLNGAKYKIGDCVRVKRDGSSIITTTDVEGVNRVDDTYEYALKGLTFLVWEHEILEVARL